METWPRAPRWMSGGSSSPTTACSFRRPRTSRLARATFTVSQAGHVAGQVHPVKEYYPASDQTWTRVDLYSTIAGDVYVSLLGYAADGSSVTIQAQVNPLVGWLWFGGGVMALGGIVVLWPKRKSRAGAG